MHHRRNKDGSRPLSKNGSRAKTKIGQTYVVFCSECPPVNNARPQDNVHVNVDGTNTPKVVKCKNGHRIIVR
jgi:hypothetical protein